MTPVDVAVIDYGMGNLHSVEKALQHVAPEANVWVGDDANVIRSAKRVVYPGVGAIRDCIAEVKKRGLDRVISEIAKTKPLLAICVGMQGLMAHSTENGGVDCLGEFSNKVEFFADVLHNAEPNSPLHALKVPHMGWNTVAQTKPHPLWKGIADNARFYFVHSYFVAAKNCDVAVGVTDYGVKVAAALARDNIFAVQFHPEKSHTDGLQLLSNFMQWDGNV
jgi:glutamine amidotransferase